VVVTNAPHCWRGQLAHQLVASAHLPGPALLAAALVAAQAPPVPRHAGKRGVRPSPLREAYSRPDDGTWRLCPFLRTHCRQPLVYLLRKLGPCKVQGALFNQDLCRPCSMSASKQVHEHCVGNQTLPKSERTIFLIPAAGM
jgi:hypothetical protein